MSLQPETIPAIPEETARIARTIFPKGNRYLLLRDNLGTIYTDELFLKLYPHGGSYAEAPWRLALVSIMQYMENYTDRQAAEAVKVRIDWKYALSLEMTDQGFDFSVLSEFRTRLVQADQEAVLLDTLLTLCRERGWRNRTRQTANRLDTCLGSYPHPQPCGMRWRNATCCAQQSLGCCSRMGADLDTH